MGVQIPSYRRAAESFEALTGVALSKSSLQSLQLEYGERLLVQQEREARALLKLPQRGEEIRPREQPAAAAETMVVSLDGVMVHLMGEGWKEVKVASFSALEEGGLVAHSYRAGLWEAEEFGRQQWAEAYRRGFAAAEQVVAVADAAPWIWKMVQTYHAPCVQIIDWWHALQKMWAGAQSLLGKGTAETAKWMETLEGLLWEGRLAALVGEIRRRLPPGEEPPEELRRLLHYLYHHRQRLRYAAFRAAGYPIGSGTVESACKVVVKERLCQGGMRWSRRGAQATMALRADLLSGRWDAVWPSLMMAA